MADTSDSVPTLPDVDWQATPHITSAMTVGAVLGVIGILGVLIGLFAPLLQGTALLIGGCVLAGSGAVCLGVYWLGMFLRHEPRNQMLAVVAAIEAGR